MTDAKLAEIRARAERGSLAAAIHCVVAIHETKCEQCPWIGRLKIDHAPSGYRAGDYVFVEPYKCNKECTIERPMTADEIAKQRADGSLLSTWLPVIGFPLSGVELVLEVDALSHLAALQEWANTLARWWRWIAQGVPILKHAKMRGCSESDLAEIQTLMDFSAAEPLHGPTQSHAEGATTQEQQAAALAEERDAARRERDELKSQIDIAVKVHTEYMILKMYDPNSADMVLKAHALMVEADNKRIAAETALAAERERPQYVKCSGCDCGILKSATKQGTNGPICIDPAVCVSQQRTVDVLTDCRTDDGCGECLKCLRERAERAEGELAKMREEFAELTRNAKALQTCYWQTPLEESAVKRIVELAEALQK